MGDTLQGPCDGTGNCCNASCQTCCDQPVYIGGWGDPFYYPGPVYFNDGGAWRPAPLAIGRDYAPAGGYVPQRRPNAAEDDLLRQFGGANASGTWICEVARGGCGHRNSVQYNPTECGACEFPRPQGANPAQALRTVSDQDLMLPSTKAVNPSSACVICTENEREVVYLPCRHLATCRECTRLLKAGDPKCPFCRARIDHTALLPKYQQEHPQEKVFAA